MQVVPFETDLFNGDAEAWTKVLGDNELLLDTNPPNLSFWDLNGIRKWNEVWAKLPQMPWHQIWRDVDEEVCILALSGAPAGVFDAAFFGTVKGQSESI